MERDQLNMCYVNPWAYTIVGISNIKENYKDMLRLSTYQNSSCYILTVDTLDGSAALSGYTKCRLCQHGPLPSHTLRYFTQLGSLAHTPENIQQSGSVMNVKRKLNNWMGQ